jgi:hypothetical protein
MQLRTEGQLADLRLPQDATGPDVDANAPTTQRSDDALASNAADADNADTRADTRGPMPRPDNAADRQEFGLRLRHDARALLREAASPGAGPATTTAATPSPVRADAPMLWNDYSVYLFNNVGRREGSLGATQLALNAELARTTLSTVSDGRAVVAFAPDGLAMLAQASGVRDPALLGDAQLASAAQYVNTSADPAQQQERLAQTLGSLQLLEQPVPPRPSVQEMKDQLWMQLKIPDKAFKKMDEGEIRAKYDELMAAMSGPAGSHETKIGKYKVGFTVDGQGHVTESHCKKKGWFSSLFSGIGHFFGKFGKTLLAVCSFIPIPWIAIPARIISGVIAVAEGIKNKNFLQAVVGVAGAVAGGAGAIAGRAMAGAAGVVSKVASTVGDIARGAQAGIQAIKSKNLLGVVQAGLSVAGAAAGIVGAGAEGVARFADQAGEWANRVLVGKQVLVSLKDGKFVQAATGAAGLVADVAGTVRGGERVAEIANQVKTYGGYADSAIRVVDQGRRGDLAGMLDGGADLVTGLQTAFGGERSNQSSDVARYLHGAADAVGVVTDLRAGRYESAFERASGVFDQVAAQRVDASGAAAQPDWTASVRRWLEHGADVVGIVDDLRHGRVERVFDTAPGVVNDIAWDLGQSGLVTAPAAGSTSATWDVKRTLDLWAGRGRDAWRVADAVVDGRYEDAAHGALALGADLGGQADAGWVRSADRLIGQAADAAGVVASLRDGDIERTLDRAAALANRVDRDWLSGARAPDATTMLQTASVWLGRGADAWRIAGQVKTGAYEAAALQGLELAIDVGGGERAGWAGPVRERGGRLIETGFGVGRAIEGRDVVAILRASTAFADALRRAAARADATPALARAA